MSYYNYVRRLLLNKRQEHRMSSSSIPTAKALATATATATATAVTILLLDATGCSTTAKEVPSDLQLHLAQQEDKAKNRNETPLLYLQRRRTRLYPHPSPLSLFQSNTTDCFWNPFSSIWNDSSSTSDSESSTNPNNPRNRNSNSPTTARYNDDLDDNIDDEPPLESLYTWYKDQIVGKGTYGTVYLARCKATEELVALKQIPKRTTNPKAFLQEMNAMEYISLKGGHPHLCALHRIFEHQKERLSSGSLQENYYVIMDAIQGGEVFDNLIEQGTYSEQDASRLIREVASALNFLHGIGLVHADLKPENLLLTQPTRGHAVVKLVDFGCAQFFPPAPSTSSGGAKNDRAKDGDDKWDKDLYQPTFAAPTPAYCPKESILKQKPIQPAADMWACGVILFILLTGAHPFDLSGDATDEEIEQRILKYPHSYRLPIDNPKITGHLSASAKDVLRKLLHPNPDRRLTALQTLEHPWVKGESIRKTQHQTTKLATNIRRFQTKLEVKFFEAAILGSDEDAKSRRRKSILQRGYQESQKTLGHTSMDLSDFSNLLRDSIRHKHFSTGQTIYRQGEKGDHMYFIESGSIQVVTKDGSVAIRHRGDFFGEGALLRPDATRSATITCQTPVHVLEISREYFEKYVAESDHNLLLTLKEKAQIRRRNHVRSILSLQENMHSKLVPHGQTFFKDGDTDADSLFVLEKGQIDVTVGNNVVFVAYPGNIIGEHSVLTKLPRNCTAKCVSKGGCVAQELLGEDFRKLAEASPHIRSTLRDLQLRREFKKAVVRRLKKKFPYKSPKEAFQAADNKDMGYLDKESVATLMRELHPGYTDDDIAEMLQTLSLTNQTGRVTFDEFQKVFIGDKRTSESM
jgi:serine/threonine protein kinase